MLNAVQSQNRQVVITSNFFFRFLEMIKSRKYAMSTRKNQSHRYFYSCWAISRISMPLDFRWWWFYLLVQLTCVFRFLSRKFFWCFISPWYLKCSITSVCVCACGRCKNPLGLLSTRDTERRYHWNAFICSILVHVMWLNGDWKRSIFCKIDIWRALNWVAKFNFTQRWNVFYSILIAPNHGIG